MKTTATALLFAGAAALNPLKARRSVAKYSDKAVPADATTKALEAAIQAPNHFLSEPWRFYTAGQMQCPARHRRDVCSTACRYGLLPATSTAAPESPDGSL